MYHQEHVRDIYGNRLNWGGGRWLGLGLRNPLLYFTDKSTSVR